MGTVYLCKNTRLGNLWAVKEVNIKSKNEIDFLAEPNILKKLSHLGIVRIIDIFYEDDNLYILEDYIEGKTLKEHLELNGPLPSEMVTDIALQLCSILDYLHSFNPPIIYRDLKPSNIMIKKDNKVVLIDFGIARSFKEGQKGDTMILGSMGYIAPEQLVNVQSNAQTDIYSLGVTMFFMLTGKSISLPTELILDENYPKQTPKNLIKIIQKASAIETESRYCDVKVMMHELNDVLSDREHTKAMFMNSTETATAAIKTVLLENKKPSKKTKLIIIAVIVCIIVLAIFLTSIMGNKGIDKKANESVTPTTAEQTTPKEVVEKETVVKGIIDMNNYQVISSGSDNEKGNNKEKNKGKNSNVQYTLNPSASISNSKLSISLTKIQVIDDEVIAILSILNTTDPSLKLDIDKTYFVNDENDSEKSNNKYSTSMISIPQSSSKQEFKLYFEKFDLDGKFYTLKTILSSDVNKDINLYFDVK